MKNAFPLSKIWLVFFLIHPVLAMARKPTMFFSQSTRREATKKESDYVVRAGTCTGFFVENTAGKTYIGTARHCFEMSVTNWCRTGGFFVDNDGKKGACKKVLAADLTHDIAFLEADFGYAPRETFRLAAFEPSEKARLRMVGYPCDAYRKCALTVTEDCWVLKAGVSSPHGANMADRSALHNCTTWGGNSGGPMVLELEDTVVGLPFTYWPANYLPRDPNELKTAAHLAEMADFVKVHRKELEKAGVVLED
jgi:hypothetical protein